jgi:hypothetical protein
MRLRQVLAQAVSAMSLAAGVIFAVIPFLISYYYVAICFLVDMVSASVHYSSTQSEHDHNSSRSAYRQLPQVMSAVAIPQLNSLL